MKSNINLQPRDRTAVRQNKFRSLLKPAITLVALAVTGFYLRNDFSEVSLEHLNFVGTPIALGAFAFAAYVAANAATYHRAAHLAGMTVSWEQVTAAATQPHLYKFIPGKVASIMVASLCLADNHKQIKRPLLIVFYFLIANLFSGILVSCCICVSTKQYLPSWIQYLIIPMTIALLMGLHPRLLSIVWKRLARRAGGAVKLPQPTTLGMLQISCLQAIGWLFLGLSYVGLARGVLPLQTFEILPIIAAVPAAVVVGYLAIFTIAGLGVREGVLFGMLAIAMPAEHASVLVVIGRVWQTLLEFVAAIIFLAYKSLRKSKLPETELT